ncbi:hypothetical protein D9619_010087 [Psilocybe cf. subviscida]|uniref:F-box domain-containing protein n=1 Tax=Psilocybe cf. subviscida TaxID=2480587 RepID=A0A8H5BKZ6_9AGAR|nr:hypothetical protein D9619_010087 [Psilocybe cf. subviscida]
MAINTSRRALQREIDEEVSNYEQRIRELKTRRNAYADISTLPQELLVDIFLLVQVGSFLKDCHRITHVCRHWRHTAISTPILWTRPPPRHHDYTNLMLERSKPANLNIVLLFQVSAATLSSLSSHIGRIQALKIFYSTDRLTDVCNRLIASGNVFSRLESLDIGRPAQLRNTVDWTLPGAFIHRASSLRSLRLSRVAFDWQMLSPLNLVSLRLMHIRLIKKISIKTLLDTLRRMPRLQHLVFTLADLLPHDIPPNQASRIALPHLQSLNLTDCNSPHIPYLLSHLLLPRLNSLLIDVSRARDGEGYSSNYFTTITTTITTGAFQVSGKLMIQPGHIQCISGLNEVFVKIWLPRATNHDHDVRRTEQLLRPMASTFYGLVQVMLTMPLNSNELVQIFGKMQQLKVVTVCGYLSLIPALTGALAHHSGHDSPQGTCTFPSLDTIGCSSLYWDQIDHNVVADFCDALVQRRNHATACRKFDPGLMSQSAHESLQRPHDPSDEALGISRTEWSLVTAASKSSGPHSLMISWSHHDLSVCNHEPAAAIRI